MPGAKLQSSPQITCLDSAANNLHSEGEVDWRAQTYNNYNLRDYCLSWPVPFSKDLFAPNELAKKNGLRTVFPFFVAYLRNRRGGLIFGAANPQQVAKINHLLISALALLTRFNVEKSRNSVGRARGRKCIWL